MRIGINIPAMLAARPGRGGWVVLLCVFLGGLLDAKFTHAQAKPASGSAVSEADTRQPLDSVIAVVNSQVILSSDLDLEMRIFRLLPINDVHDATRPKALERLTTRALIEQQIVQDDPHGLDISPNDLEASLAELRQSLPACKLRDCASAAGWQSYLATLGLSSERVAEYWSQRMAMLRFIEFRFRSGIRITQEEIDKYYRETLVPLYAKRDDAPPLEKFSSRIQEILLQERVNALLNDWLKSLQDQGQVEILDPTLRAEAAAASASNGAPEKGGRP